MSRHVSSHARRTVRRHRVWPWILAFVILVLLACAVVAGVAGWRLYSQARQVRNYEQQALQSLSSVSDLSDSTKLATVSANISSAQTDTAKARTIAHGRLWNIASSLPYVGDDVATVQGMTDVLHGIVSTSVPQLVDVVSSLQNSQLGDGSSGLNLKPILAAQSSIKKVDAEFTAQVKAYDSLATPRTSSVKTAYLSGKTKLTSVADTVDKLSNAFQILPGFLGSGQTRTYAVMAMTTSEMRSSGGLIGSVGVMTTDNGKITIGDFRANTEYIPYGSGGPTSDETRLFTTWGPLEVAFDVRDLAAFPDTSRTAEAMRTIWNRTSWGSGTTLDGVVLVDPVFLQDLVSINGNVTLSDGTVLTGSNTAEFLLNTVYKKYPTSQQDALFGEVAEQVVGSMFKDVNLTKLVKVGTAMSTMAEGRHFSMYTFDSSTEKTISSAGYTASTPSSETAPSVGVYLTEQNASKMGWYIHRTSKITRLSCNSDGSQTYKVTYTMTNTLTSSEVSSLPDYIRGVGQASQPRGYGVEKTLVYPPAGGSISGLTISGKHTDPLKTTMNGKGLYASIITLAPGASSTISFTVTTSTKATSDLKIDQTPMGWAESGVTSETDACTIGGQ
ncbi:DUF4012 domain-containing protein [uncultured Bifidobacterium sp.]|uniref:DUF4012 domain-containing protein n=1 Tax=uncultured Bifidobacterium sp. TaxID=165187 RepID=UPI0028DC2A02|nr:DUF4012 domain-containing protein [uncultured Bifidobacterium sp.]